MHICDLCLEAYQDEGIDTENEENLALVASFGSELPDHLCSEIEEGEGPRCECACNREEKKSKRRELGY